MQFGLHNSFWLDNPDPAEAFETAKAKAQWAEARGFAWFSVMDHMIQIPRVGPPDEPILEGWTVLAALAAVIGRIRLATLCTAVGYRNPAHLAKIAASVDVISRGRLTLGIDAGFFEAEYRQYGWDFPPSPATRIRQLEEAVRLIVTLWTEPRTTFQGRYFRVQDAILEPKPVRQPRPPIMIAGGGEQMTLRAVARLADACNLVGGDVGKLEVAEVRRKFDVLRRHCDTAGRDYDAIEKSIIQPWCLAGDDAAVAAKRARLADGGALRGFVGTVAEAVDLIGQYHDAGVRLLILADRRNDAESRQVFAADVMPIARPLQPMRLLILGGTGFIGPHQVRYALARGHRVTVFNRGRQQQAWPGPVEQLRGDRDGDLHALEGRDWDACIDNPTSLPVWVRNAARVLKGHVGQYVFISTISAYAANDTPADETAPLAVYDGADPMAETIESLSADRRLYGPLKARCEQEAREQYGEAATTIIRASLIVGPGDQTDRFTYWPARLARGGTILAPGDGSDPVQFIDVRDLAEWTIRVAEQRITGVFNAAGPERPVTMAEMLAGIAQGIRVVPKLVWVPTAFLRENKVSPWSDMPVWLPGQGETFGFHGRDIRRAIAAGLTCRPLPLTAADTLAWLRAFPERQRGLRAGLTAEREADLLARLKG